MPGRQINPVLLLPRQWPERVRSAVIHTISLAQLALTAARAAASRRERTRARRVCEIDRLRQELNVLREEMRLKDARMARIPGHRRPYYQPIERLAILELRAARGWSLEQAAEHMLVTPATVASWMGRLDDEGPDALVQTPEPVNQYPAFVAYLVRRLKVLCPIMGKARIANVLCRAGLHLSTTTVGRMLKERPRWRCVSKAVHSGRSIRAKGPDHIWNVDLTTVPTAMGFWCSWLPWAFPQRWPFCWWVAVAVDHFSRRIVGFAVFEHQPASAAVRTFLGRAVPTAGRSPRHLITDHGRQFTDGGFRRWCQRHDIHQRFGAVDKYGSLSVVERLIRTLKNECTRKLIVPFGRARVWSELSLFAEWYNGHRVHSWLEARTPDEVYFALPPACRAARFEPRRRWPWDSPCAGPQAPVRGRRGQRLDLDITYLIGRRHLPIVELKKAA
jgi:transposase InsO family protein